MPGNLVAHLASRPLLRRLLRPALAFLAVAAAGVAGFVVLTGVGVVEAVFWLLDPTSIALHFETASGPAKLTKLYAVAVTAGMVLTTLWAGETLFSAAVSGEIRAEVRQVREERRIMEMEKHVVVCGYGMFGRTVAASLAEAGQDVVVVEIQEEQADRARQDGFLAVTGDARREKILQRAEVDEARALVAAVDDSNVNIQSAIAASQLAPHLEMVVRVGDEMYESLAQRAGADTVVIPEVSSGQTIAQEVESAAVPAPG